MEDLFPVAPEDLSSLSDADVAKLAADLTEAIRLATSSPADFVNAEVSAADLITATGEAIETLRTVKAEIASRAAAPVEISEADAAALAALAEEAFAEETAEDAPEGDEPEGDAEPEAETAAALAAAATPPPPVKNRRLPRPPASRTPAEEQRDLVPLVAAAAALGIDAGAEFPSMEAISAAMAARRRHFGIVPEGTSGEKVVIARASWGHQYPAERKLDGDWQRNDETITAAVEQQRIVQEFERRVEGNLAASGGLCAPVTPYYNLQVVSSAVRPVRAGLTSFNADRGGLRFARPATLADVTTGVGLRTAAEDAAGGTTAAKTCQVVDCPDFEESDVNIIYHCLQFGNLGARTFPERVTQWNNLVLAAHARLAESELLTNIDTASTQVTAGDLGLGASATLFSQIAAAASAMRSRHRMDLNSVLRIMLPWWSVYLIVSDVFRGQFQRWDVDQARVVALIRSLGVEPSFYVDGAAGRSQVFGAQSDGALLSFPTTVVWYLFPEGSFLYLDGGVLELGLVRDSVLNSTNDYQIFGETFENVAFVGVESLAVESTTCDSGTVSLPDSVTCPITY